MWCLWAVVVAWVVSATKLGFHVHSRAFFLNVTKPDLQPVFQVHYLSLTVLIIHTSHSPYAPHCLFFFLHPPSGIIEI